MAMNCEESSRKYCHIVLLPPLIQYLHFDTLCSLNLVSRSVRQTLLESESSVFWQAMCSSLAFKAGLYSNTFVQIQTEPKKYFFAELWPLRDKWKSVAEQSEFQAFKIRVVCRFRPGERVENKYSLPLHQFLKLRRRQIREANNGG
jgi:hypothetical protein